MECKLQVQLGRGNEMNVKVWLLFLDGRKQLEGKLLCNFISANLQLNICVL